MVARIIVGLLFLVFAAVQYNDPDPWIWILTYALVGIICLVDTKYAIPNPIVFGLTIVFAIASAWYVPLIMNWINGGMPSIVGEMKATTPHIEWMREFLGLILCTITLFWLGKSKANKSAN